MIHSSSTTRTRFVASARSSLRHKAQHFQYAGRQAGRTVAVSYASAPVQLRPVPKGLTPRALRERLVTSRHSIVEWVKIGSQNGELLGFELARFPKVSNDAQHPLLDVVE